MMEILLLNNDKKKNKKNFPVPSDTPSFHITLNIIQRVMYVKKI